MGRCVKMERKTIWHVWRSTMKKTAVLLSLALLLTVLTGCVAYQTPPPGYGGPPPPPPPPSVAFVEPEYLYVIPTFGVYFVPGITAEVFFYSGRWYYRSGGMWYWGLSYRGPWTFIEVRRVPSGLRRLPPDYRNRYRSDYYRVPYGYWQKRKEYRPPKPSYSDPQYLYRVPKPNTYFYPGVSDEVFLHKKRWYNRHKGVWYSGPSYSGPWEHLDVERVPKDLRTIPPDYRKREKEYEKVPYEKFKKKRKGRGKDRDDDDDDDYREKRY